MRAPSITPGPHSVSRAALLFVSLTFAFVAVRAQTSYYLSADGNDANAGTSAATSWKSITKLNSVTLAPGDAVLFHRGDEFHGQITLSQSGSAALPISFAAYGSSPAKPVITGAVRLSGWTLHHGAIYVARAPSAVKNLFCNAQQMTLARYPNTGLLTVSTTNGSTTLTSTGVTQASGYWTGANIRLRTADFAFETRVITAFNGSSFTLASATIMPFTAGWGFYLDNKLEELDAPGEWYADPATNDVYFYAPNGADPNSLTVDATLLDYGVNGARSNITIQDLAFRYQARAAIRFSGTVSNVQIRGNDIFGQTLEGIRIEATSSGCVIDGNNVRLVNNRAIAMDNTTQALIANNTIAAIGLVQGYGVGIDPLHPWLYNGSSGITLWTGTNNTVRGNSLDSIGYIGIRPDGHDVLVEQNLIRNILLSLADGGGIYVCGVYGATTRRGVWRNNIIENVVGNSEGVLQPRGTTATGLYIDAKSYDMRMEGNTVVRARGMGIFIQVDSDRDTVRNNLLYDCATNIDGCYLQVFSDTTVHYGSHVIRKNLFFPMQSVSKLMWLWTNARSFHSPALFDSNYYCTPFDVNSPIVEATSQSSHRPLTLSQWQSSSGQDQHSVNPILKLDAFVITDSSASNLITNGQFTSGISGWSAWDTNAQISFAADSGLNAGCLRFRLLGSDPQPFGIAMSSPFSITSGQLYRLRFSARTRQTGKVTAEIQQHHSPYSVVESAGDFELGSTKGEFVWYWRSQVTDSQVRMNFKGTGPDCVFFLDNVDFRRVEGTAMPPEYAAPLHINRTSQPMSVSLGDETFYDLDGVEYTGTFTLPPYSSKLLIRGSGPQNKQPDAVGEAPGRPDEFALHQNYPNPFNPSTTIGYTLPAGDKVKLEVFDPLGRLTARLVDEHQEPGYHQVLFTSNDLASGTYFYRLQAGDLKSTRKFVLLR